VHTDLAEPMPRGLLKKSSKPLSLKDSPDLGEPPVPISAKMTIDVPSDASSIGSESDNEPTRFLTKNPTMWAPENGNGPADGQIDFDRETLGHMSFEDLENLPFVNDPRVPLPPPAVDPHGNPMTLIQKLNNLRKMHETDQRSLFRWQTDEEWEKTGSWFIQTLGEDLRKLMDVRMERRKIALKFEMEVKKRQKAIEVKSTDLQQELDDLRKGGSDLIRGRESSAGLTTPGKAAS
jgi:hypothetical protein